MRKILDGLYGAAEWLAMAALGVIALLVFAQVLGRVFDTIIGLFGLPPFGFLVPSLAEIAGFLLVGASFMALAGSLRGGAQIRVTLGLSAMPYRMRQVAEVFVLVIGAALSWFFFYYASKLTVDSYRFNELSYGIIAIPLWIPQAVMALGVGIFAVALVEDLFEVLAGRSPSYLAKEDGAVEEV
ncbi:TRAP transporter small permease [Nitratireductor kimnyeongensis]|uniref:TRAP transporter small permease protein n=1 Tax=Nitratireductor kimnyeongensis TaxID=430679 RepID=A0ABW0T8F4_9HYPH|nr:TRAP transporter small permease [Nitratireductor kimnyeongensis]QZZ35941.1 TRAP transporter small permease [Nitratireductor kimnyeongensis]